MDYQYEREIDLIDLFHHILKRWRVIILVALIGAVILGAYNGYKQMQPPAEPTVEEKEKALDELRKGLTDLEVAEVDSLVESYKSYAEVYADRVMYGQKSIYLNLDPEHVYRGFATYMISNYYDNKGEYTVENTDAGNIISLYNVLIKDSITAERIREVTGWTSEEQYITDLISVGSSGISILNLSIMAPTDAECRTILGILEERLEEVRDDVTKNAPHDIEIISERFTEEYNQGVSDARKGQNDTLVGLQTTMRNLSNPLTSAQKSYYNEIIKQEYPDELAEQKFSKFGLVKYAVFGFFVGAFIVMMLVAVEYIARKVLRTPDDMALMFNTRVIGIVKAEDGIKKKQFLASIDKWFEKKFDRRLGLLPREQALEMVSSEIAADMKKSDVKKLVITGTAGESAISEAVQDLELGLKDAGDISVSKSPLTDPVSVQRISEADGVVIVEKMGDSRLADIGKELDICRKLGISVLGSIVVKE